MESQVSFTYRDSRGLVSERRVVNWTEEGAYLFGFDPVAGAVRTFRKDRVLSYHDGSEAKLVDPYPEPPGKPDREASAEQRPNILFTGLQATTRKALEAQAEAAGLHVVKTVTKALAYLCTGSNAGPTKVAGARRLGAFILDEGQFAALLATGELPDDEVVLVDTALAVKAER